MDIQEIYILQGGYNMEEFYYEESNPKHIFIKCLIILFVMGLLFGIFLYIKKTNTFKLKKISINIGDSLSSDINDYIVGNIKELEDYRLYIDDVDTNKVGKYTYQVKYKKHIEEGTIEVKDNKKPEVKVSDDIVVGTEEEFDLHMLIERCTDDSLPCKVTLKNDKDLDKLKKEGTYEIDLIVSDAVGNKTNVSVNVRSSSTETLSTLQINDLEYYSNSDNDSSLNKTLFIKLDKAINEETSKYEAMLLELSSTDFDEYKSEDKNIYDIKIITAYNKYSYVIGFQVLVTYVDGTKELLEKGD